MDLLAAVLAVPLLRPADHFVRVAGPDRQHREARLAVPRHLDQQRAGALARHLATAVPLHQVQRQVERGIHTCHRSSGPARRAYRHHPLGGGRVLSGALSDGPLAAGRSRHRGRRSLGSGGWCLHSCSPPVGPSIRTSGAGRRSLLDPGRRSVGAGGPDRSDVRAGRRSRPRRGAPAQRAHPRLPARPSRRGVEHRGRVLGGCAACGAPVFKGQMGSTPASSRARRSEPNTSGSSNEAVAMVSAGEGGHFARPITSPAEETQNIDGPELDSSGRGAGDAGLERRR